MRERPVAGVDDLARRDLRPWLLGQRDRADEVGELARWLAADLCDVGPAGPRSGVVELEEHLRVEHAHQPALMAALYVAVAEWWVFLRS